MLPEIDPGIKVAAQMPAEPTDAELSFVRQMGVDHVVCWTDASNSNSDYYRASKKRYAEEGITLYGMGNRDVHNQDAIVLNLENRNAKVEEYKRHIRALGEAEIPYTTYAHMGNGIWSTERESTRGHASARGFDIENAKEGHWAGQTYSLPLSHGREYSEDEIWENYTHFIKEVAPVAEEAGVRIGIHPDDPPFPELGGIPRCIFSSFEGYKRAMEIADSPNVGICFCVGCWLEGGDLMGKSTVDSISYFGEQGKIFKVHIRNVNTPLPHFVETFIDDGYQNMYEVIKTLQEVEFDGVAIPDHIPDMAGDRKVGTAYTIAYMRAYQDRAESEVTS